MRSSFNVIIWAEIIKNRIDFYIGTCRLRDVNNLLKLDSGNTELLAQKHRLFAQAVAETKEKPETLKAAAEQANEAPAKGRLPRSSTMACRGIGPPSDYMWQEKQKCHIHLEDNGVGCSEEVLRHLRSIIWWKMIY